MILYSIIPFDVVFANNKGQETELLEAEYLGEKVQVYSTGKNEYVINRIISTSPKAFLNSKLQPGTIVNSNLNLL